jgi:hypothetical protein
MATFPATLQLDFAQHSGIEAVDVGKALIAWASAIQEASQVIDPSSPIVVDIVGVEQGCLRLHAILKFVEGTLTKADNALTPYPKIRASLSLNVFSLPGAIVAGATGALVYDIWKGAPENAPPSVKAATEQAESKLKESAAVTNDVQRFYRTLEAAPSIKGMRIYESDPDRPIVMVPRDQFPIYGGLFNEMQADQERRPRQAIWDVIVTHPVVISKPRVWRFKRDGAPFRAKLADPYFLNGIKNRTLPMQVAEGTLMRVRVDWFENNIEGQWVTDESSFVISKVVWPAPLETPVALPLFPEARH